MLNDILQIWWNLVLANTLYELLWLPAHAALRDIFDREPRWSIFPDIVCAWISVNAFMWLLGRVEITAPTTYFAFAVYVMVVNGVRWWHAHNLPPGWYKDEVMYWMLGSNLGFVIFGLQWALMSWL